MPSLPRRRVGPAFRVALLALLVVTGPPSAATAARPEPSADAAADPVPCPDCWQPGVGTTWQVQLRGAIDVAVEADAFSVDLFDVPRAIVADLHDRGRRVACYVSAGSWEDWRPDAGRYPDIVLGQPLEGWPGERWLDIRRVDLLRPILRGRLERCRRKGFDGVDFDNVDGYANETGFALTAQDQLRFDRWLAAAAHRRGLAVGLKNDLEQAALLAPHFDFAIDEQCFSYRECRLLRPFIDAGKSAVVIEYELARRAFCRRAADLGVFAMRKRLALGAWRRPC